MSIIDKATHKKTGMIAPGTFEPLSVKLEDSVISWENSSFREEHLLTMSISVRYWCTKAGQERAHKDAETLLLYALHEDVLAILSGLRVAINNGDRAASMSLVDALSRELTGS